jgi:hypothetical protein
MELLLVVEKWSGARAWLRTISAATRLSRMQESKPRRTGPMIMQPIDRGATMPVPLLPAMPSPGGSDASKKPLPKAKLTRTDAVRLAKAKITRRNSLRKQRLAQKA